MKQYPEDTKRETLKLVFISGFIEKVDSTRIYVRCCNLPHSQNLVIPSGCVRVAWSLLGLNSLIYLFSCNIEVETDSIPRCTFFYSTIARNKNC